MSGLMLSSTLALAGELDVPRATWVINEGHLVGQVHAPEADAGWTWSMRAQASLGGLSVEWVVPASGVGAERVEVPLSPPPEAFLYDAAVDYVTCVRAALVATDPEGRIVDRRRLPTAFLAWPAGREAGPDEWDAATARVRAPNGVANAALRESMGDRGDAWIQPPPPLPDLLPSGDSVGRRSE